MTAFLEWLLGRLPIGWLQLSHSRMRLAAALAGVSFANILIFMQLGFLGALLETIRLPYAEMNADLILSGADTNTLTDGSPLPRQRMYEALSVPGVLSATPLHIAKLDWKQADGSVRSLDVFGIDPAASALATPEIMAARNRLAISDTVMIDSATRNLPPALTETLARGQSFAFEARGRTLNVIGTFRIGGGFAADGYMVTSDQTFLSLFPERVSGAPNHILLRLEPGADASTVAARLRAILPDYDTMVRTVAQAAERDQSFQTTQRPVGLIFGFGVVIGIMVGIIIVYQVLSTDVADHMREYATFKAIGYPGRFFLGIVFEEALILAVMGFVPGITVAMGLYELVGKAASLPLAMTGLRAIAVLAGTLVMCALSGAIATRRLARADPADLF